MKKVPADPRSGSDTQRLREPDLGEVLSTTTVMQRRYNPAVPGWRGREEETLVRPTNGFWYNLAHGTQISSGATKYGFLAAILVAILSVFSSPGIAQAVSGNAVTDDEAIDQIAALDETAQIAKTLKTNPETLAIEVVDQIGAQGAADVLSYVAANAVDVQTNLEGSGFDPGNDISAQAAFQCGKARAAAYVFSIWGTGVCGAAALASVGALGIGCEAILLIGSNELDWNQVC